MELDNIKLQTTWNDAAGSINNNFSKIKLALAQNNGRGDVDTEMSDTSTNPVQNKTIKAYIDDLEDEINGRGYLTSAAMNQYATKAEIKDFVTKGSTLDHYGITDAVIKGSNFAATSQKPWILGYSNTAYGWKVTGPAMIFGTNGYYARFNFAQGANDNPLLYMSLVHDGQEYGWAQVVTDKNFTEYGVKAGRRYTGAYDDDPKSANDINYPSMAGFTSHLADVPFVNGNLLTITTNPNLYVGQIAIKYDGSIAARARSETTWTEWATIVTDKNISDYALPKAGGTVTGQIFINTKSGDRYFRSQGGSYDLGFGVGSGGVNRGVYDLTLGKWWIVRGASEHTDINGTLAVTGAITAKGGMLMNGQGITKWADVGNYISLPYLNINAKLLPTNTFDDGGQLAINFLQNAIYSADKRFTIEHSGEWFEYADYKFFDGSYDSFCQIRAGSTGVLTISNNGGNLIQGYPYGDIYLSFYNTNIPDSATVEVYCNYESQGIGWKTLSRTSTRGSRNGVWVYSNSYYNITHLRITMTASAASSIALCQIDWFLSRGSLSNLPVVTKFAIDQELWGRLICQGGITLGNKTITSWSDFITSDGGNINKGKYLTIGTGSLYCTESRDKLDKLFISGLIEISDLYIGERLWLEDGSSITFRNHNNPQEKDTISSFDDLRIKMISQTATDTVLIEPNVLNKWSTLTNAISLSISFLNGRASVANYYMIEFKTGDTVPTITLPSEVKWEGGYNILNNLAANTTYQISILNNLAVGGAF